MVLKCFRWSI